MTLDNQQQKLGVLQPGPAWLGSIRSHLHWSDFLHHPDLGWPQPSVRTIFYVFQICTGMESLSLSLSHRQAIRYRLGPILNRALMRSQIVVCKYLTIVTCVSCEGQTDQTPDLTWTPSSRGRWCWGHRLVFSNLFLQIVVRLLSSLPTLKLTENSLVDLYLS